MAINQNEWFQMYKWLRTSSRTNKEEKNTGKHGQQLKQATTASLQRIFIKISQYSVAPGTIPINLKI